MWVSGVEGCNEILGIREVFGWFPCLVGHGPVFPVDEVLELSSMDSGVEDGLNFIFFMAFDDDW